MLPALPKILKDSGAVLDAVGQSLMDTYDEEGIGYAVGSIEFQLMVNILMGACTREMSGELLQTIRSLRGTRGRTAGHIVTETLGGQLDEMAGFADGTKTTIHFLYNVITGAFDDFKFK